MLYDFIYSIFHILSASQCALIYLFYHQISYPNSSCYEVRFNRYVFRNGKKHARNTLSFSDIWLVQLPLSFSLSLSLSLPPLSLFSSTPFPFFLASYIAISILFLLARVVFRSRSRPRDSCRGVRRASISVAVSRGFREPRWGFPLPLPCAEPRNVSNGGDASSLRWGL